MSFSSQFLEWDQKWWSFSQQTGNFLSLWACPWVFHFVKIICSIFEQEKTVENCFIQKEQPAYPPMSTFGNTWTADGCSVLVVLKGHESLWLLNLQECNHYLKGEGLKLLCLPEGHEIQSRVTAIKPLHNVSLGFCPGQRISSGALQPHWRSFTRLCSGPVGWGQVQQLFFWPLGLAPLVPLPPLTN